MYDIVLRAGKHKKQEGTAVTARLTEGDGGVSGNAHRRYKCYFVSCPYLPREMMHGLVHIDPASVQ
jgi:hypothetical protein